MTKRVEEEKQRSYARIDFLEKFLYWTIGERIQLNQTSNGAIKKKAANILFLKNPWEYDTYLSLGLIVVGVGRVSTLVNLGMKDKQQTWRGKILSGVPKTNFTSLHIS